MIKKAAHIFLSVLLAILVLVSAFSFSVYRMECFVNNQTYYNTIPFDDCCKIPTDGIDKECCRYEIISFDFIDVCHSLFTSTSITFLHFSNVVVTTIIDASVISIITEEIHQNKAPPLLTRSILILHSVFRI